MKSQIVEIGKIKPNPKNPRIIKNDKFKKLVKSIQEFPKMLELRPIVVDEDMVVLGGNMRLRACKAAGLKKVPIVKVDDLSEAQKKEFIIKDNVSFGDWDLDLLGKDFDAKLLEEFGLDLVMNEPVEESVYDDSNAMYPLVPRFDEEYNSFVIICKSATEAARIKTKLGIDLRRRSYKNTVIGETHIVDSKEVV
jgi:hypothetical protein